MALPDPASELPRLLSAFEDGSLTAADEARLAEMLEADPEARSKYFDHVLLTAILRREGRRHAALAPSRDQRSRAGHPLRTVTRPMGGSRKRSWLLTLSASLLMCLLLWVSEATGVTQLVPTIVRVVTGEGELVIEVDDPSISVTLEGQDVTITGAGLHELRLRPGSHRMIASKDGQPLQEEVITIERGGRQVVKVRLDRGTSSTQAVATQADAFVQFANDGRRLAAFDSLARAVQGAGDGDTIEIRSNGPFLSEPIRVHEALTIRAGEGFRPVIQLSPQHPDESLLVSVAPLVLEGLEFQRPPRSRDWKAMVVGYRARLYVANCRFVVDTEVNAMGVHAPRTCVVRNCEFIGIRGYGSSFYATLDAGDRCVLDNCIHARTYIELWADRAHLENASVFLSRNTVLRESGFFHLNTQPGAGTSLRPLPIAAESCLMDTDSMIGLRFAAEAAPGAVSLPQFVNWNGKRNLYCIPQRFWSAIQGEAKPLEIAAPCKSLAQWKELWPSQEVDSLEGAVRYAGGSLHAKLAARTNVTPADFRVRPDSAGYRAAADGTDMGADVDLVGPGPAYERWKKTPQYQEWLVETGQGRPLKPGTNP